MSNNKQDTREIITCEAYRTYDGQQHETAQDARLHIAREEIKAAREASFVDDPISFVVENASEIYAILQWVFQPDSD